MKYKELLLPENSGYVSAYINLFESKYCVKISILKWFYLIKNNFSIEADGKIIEFNDYTETKLFDTKKVLQIRNESVKKLISKGKEDSKALWMSNNNLHVVNDVCRINFRELKLKLDKEDKYKQSIKNSFPCVTFAGVMDNNRDTESLVSQSGLICLDFDKENFQLKTTKEFSTITYNEIFDDIKTRAQDGAMPYIIGVFQSSSERGIHVWIKIDKNSEYYDAWDQLNELFFNKFGINADWQRRSHASTVSATYDINDNSYIHSLPEKIYKDAEGNNITTEAWWSFIEGFKTDKAKSKERKEKAELQDSQFVVSTLADKDKPEFIKLLNLLIENIDYKSIDHFADASALCSAICHGLGSEGYDYAEKLTRHYWNRKKQNFEKQYNYRVEELKNKGGCGYTFTTIYFYAKKFGISVPHEVVEVPKSQLDIIKKKAKEQADAQLNEVADSFFIIRTANESNNIALTMPPQKMLFDCLFHEGEICVLFSDSNVGKSILAVQIADSISSGVPIYGFKLEVEKQKVMYIDCELSERQFLQRSSEIENEQRYPYKFDNNFIRCEINPEQLLPPDGLSGEDVIIRAVERGIDATHAKVLVVDNITYLKNETDKGRNAITLMKELKKIAKTKNISILVIAHTPKRDMSRPIVQNDLGGSKMIFNFSDSAFALNYNQDNKTQRYLKQLKARQCDIKYDGNNVIILNVTKNSGLLQFNHSGFGKEDDFLKKSKGKSDEYTEEVIEMLNYGYTHQQISDRTGVAVGTVNNIKKRNIEKIVSKKEDTIEDDFVPF